MVDFGKVGFGLVVFLPRFLDGRLGCLRFKVLIHAMPPSITVTMQVMANILFEL
jgi:hypothetical protein